LDAKRVLIFPATLPDIFLILRRIERELSEILLKMYIGLPVELRLFWSDFNKSRIFSTDFRKKNVNFHENASSGSLMFPADCRKDGQTDR
jgi:hypothetical protein